MPYVIPKQLLAPGDYVTGQGPVRFTPDDVRGMCAQGKKMLSLGLAVPVPLEHQDSALPVDPAQALADSVLHNAGWVKDFKVARDGSLWCDIEVHHPTLTEDDLKSRVRFVSPQIHPSWTDGQGRTWRNAVTHVALTPQPVWEGQLPFGSEPIVMSLVSGRGPGPFRPLASVRAPLRLSLADAWRFAWVPDPNYKGAKRKWIGVVEDEGKRPRYQMNEPGKGRGGRKAAPGQPAPAGAQAQTPGQGRAQPGQGSFVYDPTVAGPSKYRPRRPGEGETAAEKPREAAPKQGTTRKPAAPKEAAPKGQETARAAGAAPTKEAAPPAKTAAKGKARPAWEGGEAAQDVYDELAVQIDGNPRDVLMNHWQRGAAPLTPALKGATTKALNKLADMTGGDRKLMASQIGRNVRGWAAELARAKPGRKADAIKARLRSYGHMLDRLGVSWEKAATLSAPPIPGARAKGQPADTAGTATEAGSRPAGGAGAGARGGPDDQVELRDLDLGGLADELPDAGDDDQVELADAPDDEVPEDFLPGELNQDYRRQAWEARRGGEKAGGETDGAGKEEISGTQPTPPAPEPTAQPAAPTPSAPAPPAAPPAPAPQPQAKPSRLDALRQKKQARGEATQVAKPAPVPRAQPATYAEARQAVKETSDRLESLRRAGATEEEIAGAEDEFQAAYDQANRLATPADREATAQRNRERGAAYDRRAAENVARFEAEKGPLKPSKKAKKYAAWNAAQDEFDRATQEFERGLDSDDSEERVQAARTFRDANRKYRAAMAAFESGKPERVAKPAPAPAPPKTPEQHADAIGAMSERTNLTPDEVNRHVAAMAKELGKDVGAWRAVRDRLGLPKIGKGAVADPWEIRGAITERLMRAASANRPAPQPAAPAPAPAPAPQPQPAAPAPAPARRRAAQALTGNLRKQLVPSKANVKPLERGRRQQPAPRPAPRPAPSPAPSPAPAAAPPPPAPQEAVTAYEEASAGFDARDPQSAEQLKVASDALVAAVKGQATSPARKRAIGSALSGLKKTVAPTRAAERRAERQGSRASKPAVPQIEGRPATEYFARLKAEADEAVSKAKSEGRESVDSDYVRSVEDKVNEALASMTPGEAQAVRKAMDLPSSGPGGKRGAARRIADKILERHRVIDKIRHSLAARNGGRLFARFVGGLPAPDVAPTRLSWQEAETSGQSGAKAVWTGPEKKKPKYGDEARAVLAAQGKAGAASGRVVPLPDEIPANSGGRSGFDDEYARTTKALRDKGGPNVLDDLSVWLEPSSARQKAIDDYRAGKSNPGGEGLARSVAADMVREGRADLDTMASVLADGSWKDEDPEAWYRAERRKDRKGAAKERLAGMKAKRAAADKARKKEQLKQAEADFAHFDGLANAEPDHPDHGWKRDLLRERLAQLKSELGPTVAERVGDWLTGLFESFAKPDGDDHPPGPFGLSRRDEGGNRGR